MPLGDEIATSPINCFAGETKRRRPLSHLKTSTSRSDGILEPSPSLVKVELRGVTSNVTSFFRSLGEITGDIRYTCAILLGFFRVSGEQSAL
ncbi:hypothetical protein NPIL_440391 [Nephila pilipes]|uniref:Uncharacterized protein n=1 Tax=Nephila pilipes TaxID=299642 RepID=A0A8X6TIV2_NEPPI|nr:hypothetical protein NPIL_440391 [Nephila pilipes]